MDCDVLNVLYAAVLSSDTFKKLERSAIAVTDLDHVIIWVVKEKLRNTKSFVVHFIGDILHIQSLELHFYFFDVLALLVEWNRIK